MMNPRFFLTFFIFYVGVVFANPQPPENIQTINIISGAPILGSGPNQTGGFGDVAANVLAALELKHRYPNLNIRFLVTSARERYAEQVATSAEIVKIMIPELDPNLRGVSQYYQGLEVIFLDFDFAPYLREDELSIDNMNQVRARYTAELPALIPPADVNINFSHDVEMARVLQIGAPIGIGIEEHFEYNWVVNEAYTGAQGIGSYLGLTSGPRSLGLLLFNSPPTYAENMSEIRAWAARNQVDLPDGDFPMSVAYTSEWQAVQIYIDAIATLRPQGDFVLFIKHFDELDLSRLPPNVRTVRLRGAPHQVISGIIQNSTIAPLATGNTSMGLAISAASPTRTLVYEAPPWMEAFANHLVQIYAEGSSYSPADFEPMVFHADDIRRLSREELQTRALTLAATLQNADLQNTLYQAIQRNRSRWDLIGNVIRIADELVEIDRSFAQSQTSVFARTGQWLRAAVRNSHLNILRPIRRASTSIYGMSWKDLSLFVRSFTGESCADLVTK